MIQLKRIHEPRSASDGFRVLVDRVWPRGVSKENAALDLWAKELAPSTELRKWFNHDPQRWDEFRRRYHAELAQRASEVEQFRELCANRRVTLLFGAKDTEHNQAVALKEILENRNPATRA